VVPRSLLGWLMVARSVLGGTVRSAVDMDTREFVGLVAAESPNQWHFTVTPQLCSFQGNLFGGVGLAAATEALEAVTGRPLLWASAQYLSFAKLDQQIDLELNIVVSGHNTSQARVVASTGSTEVLTVNAALGRRDTPGEGSFAEMPVLPPPQDCPPRVFRMSPEATINDHLELRVAAGRSWDELDGTPQPDGRSALWARLPSVDHVTAGTLAVLGDFVPYGMGQALGQKAGGSSLDNTLRVVRLVPTEWVLLDIRIHAIHGGFGHGLIHLWSDDGTLMATASQSAVLRHRG
jgi:acyl-CoA thioesterase II